MLERETEHIIEVLRRRTIGQAYGISVKEILAADVPQPFKAFFRTEVSVRLENELRVHRASTRFDYSSPDVLSLEQRHELCHGLVNHSGWHHQPDGTGLGQLFDKVRQRIRSNGFFLD